MYVFLCYLDRIITKLKNLQGRTRRAELGLLVRCHLSLPIQVASAATQFSLLRYEWTPDIPVDTERRNSRPHRDLNSCHLVQRGVCYAYSRTGDYHEYILLAYPDSRVSILRTRYFRYIGIPCGKGEDKRIRLS